MPQIRAIKTRGMGTICSSDNFFWIGIKKDFKPPSSRTQCHPFCIVCSKWHAIPLYALCRSWTVESFEAFLQNGFVASENIIQEIIKILEIICFEAESNVHVHRWSDVIVIVLAKWRNAMMSQYITYLSLYLMPLQKCLFWEEKKTIPLVGVSQPYVSRANLLRHSKRHEGCGTILRGWSTNWDVRWFDSFFF